MKTSLAKKESEVQIIGHLQHGNLVKSCIAYESTSTQVNRDSLNINSFVILPRIGSFILSSCKNHGYQVIRHQNAKACGQQLTVIFVSEAIPISKENRFGDKGVCIDTHYQRCTSHSIEKFYLTRPNGLKINATLL